MASPLWILPEKHLWPTTEGRRRACSQPERTIHRFITRGHAYIRRNGNPFTARGVQNCQCCCLRRIERGSLAIQVGIGQSPNDMKAVNVLYSCYEELMAAAGNPDVTTRRLMRGVRER